MDKMQTLRERLFQSSRFLVGTELVSVRGSMAERNAIKARSFANELVAGPDNQDPFPHINAVVIREEIK